MSSWCVRRFEFTHETPHRIEAAPPFDTVIKVRPAAVHGFRRDCQFAEFFFHSLAEVTPVKRVGGAILLFAGV